MYSNAENRSIKRASFYVNQNPDLPEKSVFHEADPEKSRKTPVNHANYRYLEGVEE
jgi:hypothetical protein